jgi:hypothetical protein
LAIAAVCHESIKQSVMDAKIRAKQSFKDHVDQLKLRLRLDSRAAVSSFPHHAKDRLNSDKNIHSRDIGLPPSRLRYESTVNYAYMKFDAYDASTCSGTPSGNPYLI